MLIRLAVRWLILLCWQSNWFYFLQRCSLHSVVASQLSRVGLWACCKCMQAFFCMSD